MRMQTSVLLEEVSGNLIAVIARKLILNSKQVTRDVRERGRDIEG